MVKIMLAVLVLCSTHTAIAADIYISTTGSDTTGTGTIDNPYATPFKVLDTDTNVVVSSGDTVILRGGEYPTPLGIDLRNVSNVTIQSYPGEWAHISAPINYSGITQLAPFVCLYIHPSSNNITIKNIELSGGSRYTLSMGSEWAWGTNYAHHVTVENSKIHDCGGDCVKVQPRCDNFTLINSEVYNTCRGAVNQPTVELERTTNQNCQGFDAVQVDNILLRGNHFHDIPYRNDAIVPKGGARNVLIERNLIENAMGGITLGGNSGPTYIDYVDNQEGYQIIGAVVRNNIIKNTLWHGMMVVDGKDLQIYNNTLLRVGELKPGDRLFEVNPLTTPDEAYHGNIFWIKHMNNFACADPINEPSCKTTVANNLPSDNVLIVNNVGIKDTGKGADVDPYYNSQINLDDVDQGGTLIKPVVLGTLKADHNIYYDPNFLDMRTRDQSGWVVGAATLNTIADWRRSTAHDPAYGETHSSFQNPMINTTTGAPLVGSPLIGAGITVAGLTEDFYGNPRDPAHIDIGAIQTDGAGSLPARRRHLRLRSPGGDILREQ